jgi:hypothetical protein
VARGVPVADQRRHGPKQDCLFHSRISQFCPFTPFLRRSPEKVTEKVKKFFDEVFQPPVSPQGERK